MVYWDEELKKYNDFRKELEKNRWEPCFVFRWDNIPGDEEGLLLRELFNEGELKYIKNLKIIKNKGGNLIKIFYEEDAFKLSLNKNKGKLLVLKEEGNIESEKKVKKVKKSEDELDYILTDEKLIEMKLSENKKKVILKREGGFSRDFQVVEKDGKLNIYTNRYNNSNIFDELINERIKYFISIKNNKIIEAFNNPSKLLIYLYLLHNHDYSYNIAKQFKEAIKKRKWQTIKKTNGSIHKTGYLTDGSKISHILTEMLNDEIVEVDKIVKSPKNKQDRIYYKASINPIINNLLYEEILYLIKQAGYDFLEVIHSFEIAFNSINRFSKPAIDCIDFFNEVSLQTKLKNEYVVFSYITDLLKNIDFVFKTDYNNKMKGLQSLNKYPLDFNKIINNPYYDEKTPFEISAASLSYLPNILFKYIIDQNVFKTIISEHKLYRIEANIRFNEEPFLP